MFKSYFFASIGGMIFFRSSLDFSPALEETDEFASWLTNHAATISRASYRNSSEAVLVIVAARQPSVKANSI